MFWPTVLTTFAFASVTNIAAMAADKIPSAIITGGPAKCQCVALTFDLCPVKEGDGYNTELVDYLIEKKIPATFFMSGNWIRKHPKETKRIITKPFFQVGTHGRVHTHLTGKNEEQQKLEIFGAFDILRKKYHYISDLFRPPFGEYDDLTVKITDEAKIKFVLWNYVSGDPDPHLSTERLVQVATEQMKSGSVAIFHANRNGKHTAEVIPQVYEKVIVGKKLKAVTIGEMLNMTP